MLFLSIHLYCGFVLTVDGHSGANTDDLDCTETNIPAFFLTAIQMKHINAYYNDIYTALTTVQVNLYTKAKKVSHINTPFL